jgi:hypothetical protein
MMKAQALYDLRQETEFCSGSDLHEFFMEQLGDPSPSGYRDIDAEAARHFVGRQTARMATNNCLAEDVVEFVQGVRERAWGFEN